MELATSTNLLFIRPDGRKASLEETLTRVSAAGFRVFDLNFYDWSLPGSPFLGEEWERWLDGVGETAARLGVRFGQCHAYFYNFLDQRLTEEQRQRHQQLQQRSLVCCQRLGAHTCVLHPETVAGRVDYYAPSIEANYHYFAPLLEQMKGMGLRLALENMCDYGIAPRRKFCAYPHELVELVERFSDSSIGICWDFEHGDIMEQDQAQCLRLMGKHLLATHVSDTYSKTDNTLMHVLPLTGTICWQEVMPVLGEIGYTGDFAFEVHNYLNRLPDQVADTALRLAYEVGMYLLSLGETANEG